MQWYEQLKPIQSKTRDVPITNQTDRVRNTVPSRMFLQPPKPFGLRCVSPQWSELLLVFFGLFSSSLGDSFFLDSTLPCRVFEEYMTVLDAALVYSSGVR